MLEHDLDQSIGLWLVLTADAFKRAISEEVSPHGITFRQCQVLGSLAYFGPLSQTALAETMHIEPPTLVGILDRMQRDGLIRRESCVDDRRKKLIHPTDAAQPIWSQILQCGRRVRQRASQGFTDDQLKMLQEMLETVRANLGDTSTVSSAKEAAATTT